MQISMSVHGWILAKLVAAILGFNILFYLLKLLFQVLLATLAEMK